MPVPEHEGNVVSWTGDSGAGALENCTFDGLAGLQRLDGPQVASAPEPTRFRARLTRVRFSHVTLEHFSATPHSVERGQSEIAAYPTPLLTVIHLIEGTLEVRLPTISFSVQAGQSVVLDSRQQVGLTATTSVRMFRSAVGLELIPAALQSEDATVPGPLLRTALTVGFAAFVNAVLASMQHDRAVSGPQLTKAIAQLQSAVLAEAQGAGTIAVEPAGLRARIEEQIRQHHADPGLDVATIAGAVGISIRHAHGVFNEGNRTIAAVLREQRVASAARLLRIGGSGASIGQVAHDAGFPDRDVLTRAFKHRFGITPKEYRRRHAAGTEPAL